MHKIIVSMMVAAALFVYGEAAAASFTQKSVEDKTYKIVEDTTVCFTSCDSIRICGTLTTPKKCKDFPTVILLSGSGRQNRDGLMAGHPMFRDIANHLTAHGIAVLRTDDRGTAATNGTYECATTADFAADALAAVEYLKTRKGINPKRIGLLGHSEGAAAACIATAQSKDVAFVISLSGLLSDGLSSVIRQNYDLVEASAMKPADKIRYHSIMALMASTAHEYAESDSVQSKIFERYAMWKKADYAQFKTFNPEGQDMFRFATWFYANEVARPWYRFFIRYNPADYMPHINVPFFAINGDKDVMVNAELNLGTAQRLMTHNKGFKSEVFSGLNHLMLPCEKGTPEEYPTISAPFSADVLKAITEWIKTL